MRTKNIYLGFISFFAIANFISCGENATSQTAGKPVEIAEVNGKELYSKNCKICHGADGARGMSGASNLAISELSREGRIQIITNGKGAMAAYKDQLSEQEIIAIADYLDQLKK